MPTYEYACTKCGHEFEFFQSMKDKPLTVCPEGKCKLKRWGKGRVKKMMGAGAGLIFKGSGFYITDYGKGNNGKSSSSSGPASSESKSDTKSESKSDSKSESKSDSAPAAKTETKSTTSSDSKS